MAAKRLYQVAPDFNLSSQALTKLVRDLGFHVKSHMSVATDEIMTAVRNELERQKNALKKEIEEKQRRLMARRDRQKRKSAPAKTSGKPPAKKAKEPVTPAPKDAPAQPPSKQGPPPKRQDSRRKRKRREKKRHTVDRKEVEASFKRTIANISSKARPKKHRKARSADGKIVDGEELRVIEVTEYMSVAELANKMDVNPAEVVAKCLELGMLATINQRLDLDTIQTIALEFDYDIKQVAEIGAEMLEEQEKGDFTTAERPPVVTIMGHVDHGKTSLLDHIRESNIISGESGGITQHIGAYRVKMDKGTICFLDTPGHEAFTAMRARGAHITDLVVLVVAQDDRVMPQTVEAIDHARAANVPIVVAINKMDLPGADATPVMDQLANKGLQPEEWGGDVLMYPISAKTGDGIENLLEGIILSSEMLELAAPIDKPAKGVIVDARLDKGRGPIATVLVQEGTLKSGQHFVAGESYGRARLMYDERGKVVEEAGPAVPVVVTGFSQVPQAGDTFQVTTSEQVGRDIARQRGRVKREHLYRGVRKTHLTDLHERIKEGQLKELRLVLKGDVDGSVEVLADTLQKIKSEEVAVNIILRGVGAITESDVLLAAASDAVVIGFHVRPDSRAREIATQESVDIQLYNVIYEAEAAVRAALEGMLSPEMSEEVTGMAEVRNIFRISRVGVIAGCHVTEGTIFRDCKVHLVRDGVQIYTGNIANLRRFKDDVKEVSSGYECGIRLENYNDIKVGDTLEAYRVRELERKLQT